LWPIQQNIEFHREELETYRLQRMAHQDEATLNRDAAALSQADERQEGYTASLVRGRDIAFQRSAIDRTRAAIECTRSAHLEVQNQNELLRIEYERFKLIRKRIDEINQDLTALMQGRMSLERNELFAQFMHHMLFNISGSHEGCDFWHQRRVIDFYISLLFGEVDKPRSIPAYIAYKFFPEQLEEAYLQERKGYMESWFKKTNADTVIRAKKVEEAMQRELVHYRQSPVFLHFGRPAITDQGHYDRDATGKTVHIKGLPTWLPALPARIFTIQEQKTLLEYSRQILREDIQAGHTSPKFFQVIDEIIEFCSLVQKQENHIKVPSGQYVEKHVHVRQVHDMTDEMAQELSNLPRFIAYAKIIDESEGIQRVLNNKIKTFPLQKLASYEESYPQRINGLLWNITLQQGFYKKRSDIERESRAREVRGGIRYQWNA
jgi:hypothetical protein